MDRDQMALAVGNTFVWHELYSPTAQAAMDFYSKALGWEFAKMPMSGTGGEYNTFAVNGTTVGGMIGTKETPGLEDVPPHWSIYVAVDDVDARLAKCLELGGTLIHGPIDVPDIGRMVCLKDPSGAVFWLFRGA